MIFDIDQVVKSIERLYQLPEEQPLVRVSRSIQSRQWLSLAQQFLAAATIVEREGPQHWRVVVQNTGHSLECAFKACFLAKDTEPRRGHSLVELYRAIDKLGFHLEKAQFTAIVHLHHHYFQALDTGTKFKARYPTGKSERLGGVVPETSIYKAIVASLAEQVSKAGSR